MKKIESYAASRMWKQQFIIKMQKDSMNLNNIEKHDQKLKTKLMKQEWYISKLYKSYT